MWGRVAALVNRVLCVICCCLCIRWLPIRFCREVWPCTRICVGCILIVLFGGRVCVCVLILCGWLREYVMALGAAVRFCGRVCW